MQEQIFTVRPIRLMNSDLDAGSRGAADIINNVGKADATALLVGCTAFTHIAQHPLQPQGIPVVSYVLFFRTALSEQDFAAAAGATPAAPGTVEKKLFIPGN